MVKSHGALFLLLYLIKSNQIKSNQIKSNQTNQIIDLIPKPYNTKFDTRLTHYRFHILGVPIDMPRPIYSLHDIA